jgi:hypothetical protein
MNVLIRPGTDPSSTAFIQLARNFWCVFGAAFIVHPALSRFWGVLRLQVPQFARQTWQ